MQAISKVIDGERMTIPSNVNPLLSEIIKKYDFDKPIDIDRCWDQDPKNRPEFEEILQLLQREETM